jgi:tellurite resistance protein TerC
MTPVWLWVAFGAIVVFLLALDLGVFNRKAHEVKLKEALGWTAVWILTALIFNVGIYVWKGHQPAAEFLTAYVIEKALSVDNIFVFIIIFSYFHVGKKYQHKILFWGVIGAVLMRAVFIGAGVAVIDRFAWVMYVFGAFLVFTGIKLAVKKDEKIDPENNIGVRLLKKVMPVTHSADHGHFFTRINGKLHATTLFVALVVVEMTDLIFAVDSIPAVLAVSRDPFIAYTSNIFAIMGLRSLYFALAGVMDLFHYLRFGLAVILVFVGVKMLIAEHYHFPVMVSLGVILGVLTASVAASLIWPVKKTHTDHAH